MLFSLLGYLQDLMVVCRLRKNSDFSLERGHPSDVNNNAPASSVMEQTGASEGTTAAECGSKECSSSYTSHSVEQIDSGFESDNIIPNDLSHPASSSHQKVHICNCISLSTDLIFYSIMACLFHFACALILRSYHIFPSLLELHFGSFVDKNCKVRATPFGVQIQHCPFSRTGTLDFNFSLWLDVYSSLRLIFISSLGSRNVTVTKRIVLLKL